ncbi:NIF-domain-containing protein [Fusarium austroafricanum]|uniref:NIF-domain-containing protein n=1 Tax=Fusarium austroafricanum TaxID=2364996 RepID=A0A8H4JUP0_9HYPO|nr:NIF-domain-containing protein [Fusarium austroafricanum]
MPSLYKIVPKSLAIIATYAQWASALGCNKGLRFNYLHGAEADMTQEVMNDIHTTCSMAAGKIIKPDEPFWLCTNWEKNMSPNPNCYLDCIELCNVLKESVRFTCLPSCKQDCVKPPEGGFNKIHWAIEVREGQTEHEITYEQCIEAFNTELAACPMGSESNHHGFWFRIDPEMGGCP